MWSFEEFWAEQADEVMILFRVYHYFSPEITYIANILRVIFRSQKNMCACNPVFKKMVTSYFLRTRATGPVAWTLVCHPRGHLKHSPFGFREKPPFQKGPPKNPWQKQRVATFGLKIPGDVAGAKQEDLWTHVPRDPGVALCCWMGKGGTDKDLFYPEILVMAGWRFIMNEDGCFLLKVVVFQCHDSFLGCLYRIIVPLFFDASVFCSISWQLNKRDTINYDNIPSLKLTLYWTSRSSQNLYLFGWLPGVSGPLGHPCDRKPKR